MTIDADPFPSVTINMVSMSAECKCIEKDLEKVRLSKPSKQVWRTKSVIVKDHCKELSKVYPD